MAFNREKKRGIDENEGFVRAQIKGTILGGGPAKKGRIRKCRGENLCEAPLAKKRKVFLDEQGGLRFDGGGRHRALKAL